MGGKGQDAFFDAFLSAGVLRRRRHDLQQARALKPTEIPPFFPTLLPDLHPAEDLSHFKLNIKRLFYLD
jgi:hypothetical protein